MENNHPNPHWLQREEIVSFIKEARSIIAKNPESLTDSPSPVADVVVGVLSDSLSCTAAIQTLEEIIKKHVNDDAARVAAMDSVKRLEISLDPWLVGEVVEGVLADPISRLALNSVELHETTSQRNKGTRA